MEFRQFFSPDFAAARERFLAAATPVALRRAAHRLLATGPRGEPLDIDVITLGAAQPDRVILVSSGLHGVEGFFGSAVQLAWLTTRLSETALPPRTTVVLLHALNPFGFAWLRRVNEHNVDLNRNFLDDYQAVANDPAYQESRAAYQRFAPFLNPHAPASRWEPYPLKALVHLLSEGYRVQRTETRDARFKPLAIRQWMRLGLASLQRTLPVGQYDDPQGLFYGGTEPEETTRTLRELLPELVGDAQEILQLDLHTGLGRHGEYRLLINEPPGSDDERRASAAFGSQTIEPSGGPTAYQARGLMTRDLRTRLNDRQYLGITAEFGTAPPAQVLRALRAENQAWFYNDPESRTYRWAKRMLLEAFCPSSPRWRDRVVSQGVALMDHALAAGTPS